jgi:hypothetical protein
MAGRRRFVLACLPILVVSLAGCGAAEDKAQSLASTAVNKGVNDAAELIVREAFTDALKKANVTLVGDPDCSSKLRTDVKGLTVKGSVSCTGKTDKGHSTSATFRGVIAVGNTATACKGRFIVKVAGQAKVNKDIDVCAAAKAR